jgi:hypothetical protein
MHPLTELLPAAAPIVRVGERWCYRDTFTGLPTERAIGIPCDVVHGGARPKPLLPRNALGRFARLSTLAAWTDAHRRAFSDEQFTRLSEFATQLSGGTAVRRAAPAQLLRANGGTLDEETYFGLSGREAELHSAFDAAFERSERTRELRAPAMCDPSAANAAAAAAAAAAASVPSVFLAPPAAPSRKRAGTQPMDAAKTQKKPKKLHAANGDAGELPPLPMLVDKPAKMKKPKTPAAKPAKPNGANDATVAKLLALLEAQKAKKAPATKKAAPKKRTKKKAESEEKASE